MRQRWLGLDAPRGGGVGPKRLADRSRAFTLSISRLRGRAFVRRELKSSRATSVTLSTARLNGSSFALEGRVKPLSFRHNWRAEARISSSVAGGAKLCRVFMFLHIGFFLV